MPGSSSLDSGRCVTDKVVLGEEGEGNEKEREIVGVMFVNYRRPNRFSEDERRLIETLASAAAAAIRNRRLMEAINATDRELLDPSPGDVFGHIADRARMFTSARFGEVLRIHQATGDLQSLGTSPGSGDDLDDRTRRRINDFARKIIDEWPLPEEDWSSKSEDSAFGVPLCDGSGSIVGALVVYDSRPDAFHPRVQTLLEAFAVQAVLALRNAEYQRRLVDGQAQIVG